MAASSTVFSPVRAWQWIFWSLGAILCFFPWFSPPLALVTGFALTQLIGHPFGDRLEGWTKQLLKGSIIGLGFGIPFAQALEAGYAGFGLAAGSIAFTLLSGWLLAWLLRVEAGIGQLISVGTAICGGSAIAATAPVLDAKPRQVSVALGTVFLLNSLALLLFPPLGKLLGLSQEAFGWWAAIAIHDTSSVVGAAAAFGEEALAIATTVKLARALWIIPLLLLLAFWRRQGGGKVKLPWFILGFVGAMLLATYGPEWTVFYSGISWLAKRSLVLSLLLIGGALNLQLIRQAGLRPLVLGTGLWLLVAAGSLGVIWFS
jgi:uncharacterized integral membrane protein (TIGR00698 family)